MYLHWVVGRQYVVMYIGAPVIKRRLSTNERNNFNLRLCRALLFQRVR